MDIHKPKPWHGLREFLKEYVIIVVGVLTALGAEQGVEWLHWRHLAERAEADLTAGLQPDLLNSVTWLGAAPCHRAWMTPLVAALRSPDPAWRAAPLRMPELSQRIIPRVFNTPGFIWSHAAWETAQGSGVLNHLPQDRVKRYAQVYRLVELARQQVTYAGEVMDDLGPLAFDQHLTEPEKRTYLQRLTRLETIIHTSESMSRRILQGAHELGVDPPADRLRARMDGLRRSYGACAAEVKLPLPSQSLE